MCIARLPRHASIVRPRSRCPHCGVPIRAADNLPLLSWVWLRGHCRSCGWKIPWRYPAVEFATAALFLLVYLQFGLTITGAGMAVFCFLLLGLAVMDAETMRLPDTFTLPGIALGVLYAAMRPAATMQGHLLHAGVSILWALVAALALLTIRWVYWFLRHVEGMGLGDVKLLAMIAAWLGAELSLLTLALGTIGAAVFGVVLLAASPRERRPQSTRLPFGAFLCAAAIYSAFAGAPIIEWYMRFFS